jgi:hypothetical protein
VVVVVGCHGHFNSLWKDVWGQNGFSQACKITPGCPKSAIPMEKAFVAFVNICLILSSLSIIASFVMDASRIKIPVNLIYIYLVIQIYT